MTGFSFGGRGTPAIISDIRVRRTFAKLNQFFPLADHEWARFDALVDEVVTDLRRARGDVLADSEQGRGQPLRQSRVDDPVFYSDLGVASMAAAMEKIPASLSVAEKLQMRAIARMCEAGVIAVAKKIGG